MMVFFFLETCCGCLVASSWDIFLCILSSLHASMLGLGGFEFDVLGTGFIITGLDDFDLERWTATSTASAPEGSSKISTALISIQGLWICDIFYEGAWDEKLVKICGPRSGSALPDNNLDSLGSRRK